MPNIKDIKNRITSIREISKITRAMKMVSTAKYKKAMRLLTDRKDYVSELENLLVAVSRDVIVRHVPYFKENTGVQKDLLIVVTADKGLCGSFNTNIARTAKQNMGTHTELYLIGKRGRNALQRECSDRIVGVETDLADRDLFKACATIMNAAKKGYREKKYSRVRVVYNHFESMGRQPIVIDTLLPLKPLDTIKQKSMRRMMLEPSPETVFNHTLDHYINVQLFKILLESNLSEHITRMNAMEAATKNASELIDKLVLQYNRARQSMITTELLEVVNGAEALQQ